MVNLSRNWKNIQKQLTSYCYKGIYILKACSYQMNIVYYIANSKTQKHSLHNIAHKSLNLGACQIGSKLILNYVADFISTQTQKKKHQFTLNKTKIVTDIFSGTRLKINILSKYRAKQVICDKWENYFTTRWVSGARVHATFTGIIEH